eukprot:8346379-Heterocapsa_arctica.AAC.1
MTRGARMLSDRGHSEDGEDDRQQFQEHAAVSYVEVKEKFPDFYETGDVEVDERTKEELRGERKKKDNYAVIDASDFRDFFLRSRLLPAIANCGFEQPE